MMDKNLSNNLARWRNASREIKWLIESNKVLDEMIEKGIVSVEELNANKQRFTQNAARFGNRAPQEGDRTQILNDYYGKIMAHEDFFNNTLYYGNFNNLSQEQQKEITEHAAILGAQVNDMKLDSDYEFNAYLTQELEGKIAARLKLKEQMSTPEGAFNTLRKMTRICDQGVNWWANVDKGAIEKSGLNSLLTKFYDLEDVVMANSSITAEQLDLANGFFHDIGMAIQQLPAHERARVLEGIEKCGSSFPNEIRSSLSVCLEDFEAEDRTAQQQKQGTYTVEDLFGNEVGEGEQVVNTDVSNYFDETHETVNKTTQEEESPEERNA